MRNVEHSEAQGALRNVGAGASARRSQPGGLPLFVYPRGKAGLHGERFAWSGRSFDRSTVCGWKFPFV